MQLYFFKLRLYLVEKFFLKSFSLLSLFDGSIPEVSVNPFGGLNPRELDQVLVPEFDPEVLEKSIRSNDDTVFEIIGKHGRGKTGHLKAIALRFEGEDSEYYSLLTDFEVKTNHRFLFIDSFHRLSFKQQFKILAEHKGALVHTNHFSHKVLYLLAGKNFKTLKIGKSSALVLEQLIENRVRLFSQSSDTEIKVSRAECEKLVRYFGTDIRGILYLLYNKFQKYRHAET